MDDTFSLHHTTKTPPPRLPFVLMKRAVLGNEYHLSLVCIGDRRSRALNATYRGKNKPTNILSFPLSPRSGEIFINTRLAHKQARAFNMTPTQFFGKLVIHGMLHLKGFEHGSKMESTEARFVKKFFS